MSWQTRVLFLAALICFLVAQDAEDRYFGMACALVGHVCWAIDRLRRFV